MYHIFFHIFCCVWYIGPIWLYLFLMHLSFVYWSLFFPHLSLSHFLLLLQFFCFGSQTLALACFPFFLPSMLVYCTFLPSLNVCLPFHPLFLHVSLFTLSDFLSLFPDSLYVFSPLTSVCLFLSTSLHVCRFFLRLLCLRASLSFRPFFCLFLFILTICVSFFLLHLSICLFVSLRLSVCLPLSLFHPSLVDYLSLPPSLALFPPIYVSMYA